ncbi:hypothetical protein ACFLUO_07355 [Chloroflexota bacterium]
MKRHVIGMDIDGVIVDIATAMLPLLSEVCARPVVYQDLCSWDLGKALSINEETMNHTWNRFLDSDELRYAHPIDGAITGLSAISENEIWLVTSRPVSTQGLTLSWLHDNRVHYDQIVFNRRGDKLSVGPTFNVFVEDFLDETITIAKAGIFTILFDQPWNQASKLPINCKRAYNWGDVLQLINNLDLGPSDT